MTQKDVLVKIWSDHKWYGGLRTMQGKFYTAQTANRVKHRYKNNKLSQHIIDYIIGVRGYTKTKEAEYEPTFSTK